MQIHIRASCIPDTSSGPDLIRRHPGQVSVIPRTATSLVITAFKTNTIIVSECWWCLKRHIKANGLYCNMGTICLKTSGVLTFILTAGDKGSIGDPSLDMAA